MELTITTTGLHLGHLLKSSTTSHSRIPNIFWRTLTVRVLGTYNVHCSIDSKNFDKYMNFISSFKAARKYICLREDIIIEVFYDHKSKVKLDEALTPCRF